MITRRVSARGLCNGTREKHSSRSRTNAKRTPLHKPPPCNEKSAVMKTAMERCEAGYSSRDKRLATSRRAGLDPPSGRTGRLDPQNSGLNFALREPPQH